MVKNQDTEYENGIYVVVTNSESEVHLRRATDADNNPNNELSDGAFTFISEGTVYGDTGFILTSNNGVATTGTIGAGTITFTQFSSAQSNIISTDSIKRDGNKFYFSGHLEDAQQTVLEIPRNRY